MRPTRRPLSWTLLLATAMLSIVLGDLARSDSQAGADLYGKPLRGLSPVALKTLLQNPDPFRDRTIRVTGKGSGGGGLVTISEEAASLAVKTDGSFALPEKVDGASVTAEGRLRTEKGSGLVFVATGVEVRK